MLCYPRTSQLSPLVVLLVSIGCGASETTTAVEPAVPLAITRLAGNNSTGVVGSQAVPSPTVRVTGTASRPIAGVAVEFVVESGGGSVSKRVVSTDANGEAAAEWQLGTIAGGNTLSVVVAALPPVSFSATGTAGPAASIVIASGNDQSAPLGSTIYGHAVRVLDLHGNGVPGVRVTFAVASGSGSTEEPQLTNAAGVATGLGWTLGPQPGTQQLTASVPNVAAVAFSATALGIELVSLAAGQGHTCGLSKTGAAYCWGANDSGQLGDGATTDRLKPTLVLGGLKFSSISAGSAHTCGVSERKAFCWGANSAGQLGSGSLESHFSPEAVVGGHLFERLEAGGDHTCGIADAIGTYGSVLCWGKNASGQLGDGTNESRSAPVVAGANWLRGAVYYWPTIAAGASHTCVIFEESKDTYCWGRKHNADQTVQDVLTPTRLSPRVSLWSITAGGDHTCGVEEGVLGMHGTCWGLNSSGALGDGSTLTPVLVTTIANFRFFRESILAAGARHTCATLYWNQRTHCWGDNTHGQLGDGTNDDRLTPMPVGGTEWASFDILAAGTGHSCRARTGGAVYCWGLNDKGQLGNETRMSRSTPVLVTSF